MGYSDDTAMGDSIGVPAMAEVLHPGEQLERFGWATAAPSPERCTYVFVPAMSGDTADALASDAFGAILRLGSFSDIEETARDIRPQADHYPRQHLRDAGSADAALSQASGGLQGILLACDGRILLRSNEKMYLDTCDYYQYSSGNYDLEVDGTMRFATTGSDGGITISSAQDTMVLESGPGQDITISAGDGTGNITENVYTRTRKYFGQEFTMTKEGSRKFVEQTQINFFAGATINTTAAANLYVNFGADVLARSLVFRFSFHQFDWRLFYLDITYFHKYKERILCFKKCFAVESTDNDFSDSSVDDSRANIIIDGQGSENMSFMSSKTNAQKFDLSSVRDGIHNNNTNIKNIM